MKYEWDELKNRRNIEKHNISFKEASQMFDRPMLSNLDQREEYGEDRWIGLGLLQSGKVAVVAFTENQMT